MADEECVPIPGFGLYTITRSGVVRNAKTGKVRKPTAGKYPRVILYRSSKPKDISSQAIHRLVALTFIKRTDSDEKNIVNHKDGNPTNNDAKNLEWVTSAENTRHAIRTGLMVTSKPRKLIVEAIDPKTEKVLTNYPSPLEASRVLGLNVKEIKMALKTGDVYGHTKWRVFDEESPPDEEWKELPDCDGYEFTVCYAVSSCGRVRNEKTRRQLIRREGRDGYHRVTLSVRGQKQAGRPFPVHRLIATAFLENPNPSNKLEVDHINSNRSDNRASNLQWLDKKTHAAKTNNRKVAQISKTGEVIALHVSLKAAVEAAGCESRQMFATLQGEHITCRGYCWQYAEEHHIVGAKVSIVRDESKTASHKSFQPVVQKDSNGNIIAEFRSMKEAAAAVNGDCNAISKAVRGLKKEYKGYLWGRATPRSSVEFDRSKEDNNEAVTGMPAQSGDLI